MACRCYSHEADEFNLTIRTLDFLAFPLGKRKKYFLIYTLYTFREKAWVKLGESRDLAGGGILFGIGFFIYKLAAAHGN